MPHLSKRVLDSKIKKDLLISLPLVLKEARTQNEAEIFFGAILTETERLMISKRLIAAFLLRHNIEAQKIGDILKLSTATLSKLGLWIKLNQEGFNLIFNKLEKERRVTIAKEFLYKILDYAIRASTGHVRNIIKVKL